jgi:hypothetical protein
MMIVMKPTATRVTAAAALAGKGLSAPPVAGAAV